MAARSTAHALLREAGRFLAQNYSDVVDDDDVLEVTVAPPVAEVQLRLQVVNGPDPVVVGWWYDTVMDAGP